MRQEEKTIRPGHPPTIGIIMPLDHYVSQVHLKNFYSLASDSHMHAIRKSDLTRFRCNAQSVCRIEDGSTNAYLREDRSIEKFLVDVEPKYNASVAKLRNGEIDQEYIYAVAGFAAYVACCSPAAMRIHTGPLESILESTATILDRQGLFDKAPAALGGKSLPELLADRTVRFEVDRKYPQAIGIDNIIKQVSIWGNSTWEILLNNDPSSPFFTSDFPMAIEATSDPRVLGRIVPLAPDLAVRIIPNIEMSQAEPDLSFTKFSHSRQILKGYEIRQINRLLVQCAEDIIFHCDDHNWIEGFIAKNRHYRIEPVTIHIPQARGILQWFTQRIVSRKAGGA